MSDPPIAIITGASAGIGVALAQEAAHDGFRTLLVARRKDRLDALAATLPGEPLVFAADLAAPGACAELAAYAADQPGRVEVLVNNAGFGRAGPFCGNPEDPDGRLEFDRPIEHDVKMVDLNVRAVVELTHRLLPSMLEAGTGGILNVASTAAFQPGPRASVYYASKAFVLSFSEALYEETRRTGVTVTALCPGPTETEFFALADMDRVWLRSLSKAMDADAVAATGWRAFRRGRRTVIPGVLNKAVAMVARVAPRRTVLPVVHLLQKDRRQRR